MNRNAAKLLTFAGVFCCLLPAILWVLNRAEIVRVQQSVLLLFLVGGIVIIVVSLAYYTEK